MSRRAYEPDDLLDQDGAEEFTSGLVKARTFEDMRYRGGGPKFVKLGKGGKRAPVAYRVADLRDWIARRTVDPQAESR